MITGNRTGREAGRDQASDRRESQDASTVPGAARTAAVALAASLIALTVVLGYFDGTGLFAPENWVNAGLVPTAASSPAWATVTFVPALIAGSALALFATVRAARPGVRARWVLGAAWSTVVLSAFFAKLAYSVLLVAVAGPVGLHPWPTVTAVLAECGLTGAKYAFVGVFAAAPAALAYLISCRRRQVEVPGPARGGPGPVSPCSLLSLLAGAMIGSAVAAGSYAWLEGSGRAIILPGFGALGSWAALRYLWPLVGAGLSVAVTPFAAWWIRGAVTAAACALGFLVPFAVDGSVNGFGGVWVWKKACGDPQSSAGDAVAGGLNLISCRTGRTVPSPAFQTAALSEAYARAAPGLHSLSSSPASVNLHVTGDGSGAVDVWVPGVARPQITASGLTEVLTAQPDSGWRPTARAVGQYTLAVR